VISVTVLHEQSTGTHFQLTVSSI